MPVRVHEASFLEMIPFSRVSPSDITGNAYSTEEFQGHFYVYYAADEETRAAAGKRTCTTVPWSDRTSSSPRSWRTNASISERPSPPGSMSLALALGLR